MLVAMYYNNRDIRIEEMQRPKIGPNEILVRTVACGVCGSDVMEWYRIKKAPRVLGHEITGEVEEIGDHVKAFKVGDRVFVSHHVPCNKCLYCLDGQQTVCETLHNTSFDPGGFSEFVRVPKINVDYGTFLLPNEISFVDGTLIEPLGCVIRGQRRANIRSNHTVLVLGSGVSGLLHIKLARARGVERVIATDINEYRMNAAKKFGADIVFDARDEVPRRVREANKGRLADRIIVCTGAVSAVRQALKSVDSGGTILFFAPTEPRVDISLRFNEFWTKQITLTSTYAAAPNDIEKAMEYIRSGKVNVHNMITHQLSLAETSRGFQLVADAKESMKVIIKPAIETQFD
ncbi:MAG: alcohol dehydrogenase catalytic domain-containing protein [Candidatus Bathyarchaeota archaeon]|nr:MAG: alcohol dehydrogenase catalytic domain-containing protein [Candidatus Bathyarchaeota archaeon]